MKNTTLLKVLSATAIFSAIAAIEAYDQDNFTFAAETPVVASNSAAATTPATAAPTATTPATTTTSTTPAHNAEEPATVAQDVKALKDGEYNITAEALKFYEEGRPSMAAAAIDIDKTKLIVKNGQYSVNVSFKSITFGGLNGYLGNLKYYDGDKTHENRKEIQDSEFKDSTIVENYSASETDNFVDVYKKEFPGRTVYPKTVNYNVDKNKIDSNNKLETYTEVFVPVMASINPAFGTQKMTLKFDLSSLARKKVTANNYEAATYENPNKDVEYKGTIKKDFPIHVQGHLRNANNNDEESLYGSALDNYVKVEKVGDKYKYTLRFKKGLADVGGEFYPFELHKVAYQGKDIPLTTLASNGNTSVKEGSIITDKLLEKIQLDGTAPYPNGALMSHFVTLKLYYETATAYKERPVKLEDVVAPAKPKPVNPTPTTPKEEPKPATPTAADHNVDADKVPNTFPTTVKAELNGRTTGTASIYENAFVKDVKVEKVGDKYQYTIQVKEGKSTNFLLRNKPFTVSKLTYKGTEINFTEVDAATKLKEGKILTDSLLDKIQVDAVFNVQTKGGAKPRFEDRTAESTIALDFPKVEKPKEVTPAKPSVPDREVAADKVPTTFPAIVKGELNGRTTDSSSIYEDAFVKDVKVEKVGDKYQYTIQVKEGKSSTYLLRNKPFTVSKLTYKGTEVNFTEVDATTKLKEGKILTDSLLDKIQVDTVISVQTRGGATPRFEERNAENTISLDFPTAEKVKEEAANNLVPAIINNAHESNRTSMANDALVHEKTRVEKVNDTYNYYLTFKDLNIGPLVGTVDTLTVDGTAAERTDLGGESHEKVFHFTSPEKLTEKTITFSVSVDGKPLRGHSNVAATLKFNWGNATPLTADQVTSLHKDETTKAQAEKERLEKEKAQKAEADRLEKERLEKEAAAKAEKERLEKEKALKEAVEKIQAENKKIEEQAKKDAETTKETVTKLEAAKAQLEKLVKEKEEAISKATSESEKEKLTTEKTAAERELTAKVTELKTETEKAVKLENKVKEIEKLEKVKNEAVKDIANDKSLSKEEAKQLEAIVKTASLKDTLVAKVVENGSTEEIKVSFDNTAVKATKFVVEKVNEKTVAKVEELVKKADKNLNVVKTIDLHFTDDNGAVINKQGETRTVTVAVVANEGEKLEVYYVNGDKLEKVPSVYKDGKLTFFTSHFSLYAIVKTVASNQDTSVPVKPDTSDNKVTNKETKSETKEQNVKEEAEATPQNIFGEVEKTVSKNTSQTVTKEFKQLAKTGLNATATAGLGVLALLSALVLRRKNNK